MKKLFLIACCTLLITSCFKKEEKQQETTTQAKIDVDISEKVYSFDLNTLTSGCDESSEIICAINTSIKCTINPEFSDCEQAKNAMPKFVFLNDENLQRPTSQSYKVNKLKPLPDGTVEVYTQSTCNGNWFGLCNGNIIYIMTNKNNTWIVKEIYAIES